MLLPRALQVFSAEPTYVTSPKNLLLVGPTPSG